MLRYRRELFEIDKTILTDTASSNLVTTTNLTPPDYGAHLEQRDFA